jgi:hypothetical protein
MQPGKQQPAESCTATSSTMQLSLSTKVKNHTCEFAGKVLHEQA